MHGFKPMVKAGKVLSLVAILFASVGSHLVHLSYHQQFACGVGLAADSSDQNAALIAKSKDAGECPVCSFLSHFQLHGCSSGCSLALLDRVPKATISAVLPVFWNSFARPHGPRAPPRCILSIGLT